MSSSAYIRDLSSLKQLRTAISQFSSSCETAMHEVDLSIAQRITRIEELVKTLEARKYEAQYALEQARSALNSCQSRRTKDSNGNDVEPNCSAQEKALADCQRKYSEAEYRFQKSTAEISKVKQLLPMYLHPAKSQLKSRLTHLQTGAISGLSQLINGAENYQSVQMLGSVSKGPPIATPQAGDGGENGSFFRNLSNEAKIENEWTSFMGASGSMLRIANGIQNGIIASMVHGKGEASCCSELKIGQHGERNLAQIVKVNIPEVLREERIGSQLIANMESIAGTNGCDEIYGWTSTNNIGFYRDLGYLMRKEITGVGAEFYKKLI